LGGQRGLGDYVVLHRPPGDQVFLDDPLEHGRIAVAVPGSLRVHHGDRSLPADAQAVGLGAVDAAAFGQPQRFEPSLEVLPCGQPALPVAALGGGLVCAEEDVPPDRGDPQLLERLGKGVGFRLGHESLGMMNVGM